MCIYRVHRKVLGRPLSLQSFIADIYSNHKNTMHIQGVIRKSLKGLYLGNLSLQKYTSNYKSTLQKCKHLYYGI